MMQCGAVGDSLLSFIYCAVMCIGGVGVEEGAEITVPGNISQRSGIQSSAVWHFSTDRWPAESGVAHPYYLLPGCELNINQTSFIRLRKVMLEHENSVCKEKILTWSFEKGMVSHKHQTFSFV